MMEDTDPEEAVTVAVAARRLGVDPSTVRAMLRNGELAGFKVGKGREPGGVRVEAASIRAYKARHAISAPTPAVRPPRRPVFGFGHYDAMRYLREIGCVDEPESEDEKRFWSQHRRLFPAKRKKR